MGLEVMVIFKGPTDVGVLLNLTVAVSVFTSALQSQPVFSISNGAQKYHLP